MIYRNDRPTIQYDPKQPVNISWEEPVTTMKLGTFQPETIEAILWEYRTALVMGSGGRIPTWRFPIDLVEVLNGVSTSLGVQREHADWFFSLEFAHLDGRICGQKLLISREGDDPYTVALGAFLEQVWETKHDDTALLTIWHATSTPEPNEGGFYLSIAPGFDGRPYRKGPNYCERMPQSNCLEFWRSAWRTYTTVWDQNIRNARVLVNGYYAKVKKLELKHLESIVSTSNLIGGRARKYGLREEIAKEFLAQLPKPSECKEFQAALYFEPYSTSVGLWRSVISPCKASSASNACSLFRSGKHRFEDLLIVRRYDDDHLKRGYHATYCIEHYQE